MTLLAEKCPAAGTLAVFVLVLPILKSFAFRKILETWNRVLAENQQEIWSEIVQKITNF